MTSIQMHVKCKDLLEREDGITYCLHYVVTARNEKLNFENQSINQIKKTGLIKMIKIFEMRTYYEKGDLSHDVRER